MGSEEAENDLDSIVSFIAKDDVDVAIRMDKLFRAKAGELAQFPLMGREGRIPETREWFAHKNYRLIYRVGKDAIEIVTIVHAARNFPLAKEENSH